MTECKECICAFNKEKSANEKRHQCHTDAANRDKGPGCLLVAVALPDYRIDCLHNLSPYKKQRAGFYDKTRRRLI